MPVYLDNAATTFPKPEAVYRAQDEVARRCGANPGRGGYRLAQQAAQVVSQAREQVANFFHIVDSRCLVFTASATQSVNMALFGLLQPGDRVVTTSMEHNAVARPLHHLQQHGIEVVHVAADPRGCINLADIRQACQVPTRLVVVNHCSNVSGTVQPVEDIGRWCRAQGILFMVDAAQSAGILPLDVEEMGIDLLAAPGHKGLLGPQGTGVLYVHPELTLRPLIYGGTGTFSSQLEQPESLPESLESGTLNLAGLAGLAAGLDFIEQTGRERILVHEQALLKQMWQGLSALSGVTLYGPGPDSGRCAGALSLVIDGQDPSVTGFFLDQKFDIAVRVGLHCAPLAHRTLGSWPLGTVRVSPGFFNTEEDIEAFIAAIAALR
ncbi:MAG: aminotransferase class V-fold PLP-dependent enzyme [Desulfuromonadaceae bacterium]|nr:aminotransferase class V-fold PLP-dependent enzyme [Desulfuromonadaceae bacterium]